MVASIDAVLPSLFPKHRRYAHELCLLVLLQEYLQNHEYVDLCRSLQWSQVIANTGAECIGPRQKLNKYEPSLGSFMKYSALGFRRSSGPAKISPGGSTHLKYYRASEASP